MMHWNAQTNEDALDVLADMIEPAAEIFADKTLAEFLKNGQNLKAVQYGIKHHKKSIIKILATLEGVSENEYKCNVLTLPITLIDLLNDADVVRLFTSQAQTTAATSSGLAMATTAATEIN